MDSSQLQSCAVPQVCTIALVGSMNAFFLPDKDAGSAAGTVVLSTGESWLTVMVNDGH